MNARKGEETMENPGGVITNRLSGVRIEFLETASSTGGARLRFLHLIRRPGTFAERHGHPNQDETIRVESGSLRVEIEGAVHELAQGESVTVPRGKRHQPTNTGDGELQMQVEFRPAKRMETWLEQLYGCCNYTGRRGGQLGLLQKTVWINRYEMFAADHSVWFQRSFSAIVGPTIGRLFGYRPYNPNFASAAYAPRAVQEYATTDAAKRAS